MLPIIDLSGPLAEVAAQVREACLTHGFFYVRNHGVPEALIARTVEQAKLFFRQPLEEKRKAKVNMRHRGFNALGDALMYGATKPDYKEFFSIGLELPEDDHDVVAGQALRGPNNWPPGKPEFREALSAYYEALGACGARLLRGVAQSLGVAPDFFVDKYQKRLQRTQIIYYPPHPPAASRVANDGEATVVATPFAAYPALAAEPPDPPALAAPPAPTVIVSVLPGVTRSGCTTIWPAAPPPPPQDWLAPAGETPA